VKRTFARAERLMNPKESRITRRCSLAGLVVFMTLAASASTVSFKPLQTYPVGMSPFSVAMGDFNGDGKMDLAVLNTGDATISILLGNGDGSFQPATSLEGDTNAAVIVSADLNGDQRADLVTTGDSGITVLLGHGDGTFGAPQHFDGGVGVSPGEPRRIVVADFNSDGKPDLVVVNANGVGILLGNGDGSFQARIDYSIGTGTGFGTVVAGDFNGDNREDLAVGIVILLGNGDGTFQPPVSLKGFSRVWYVADFDNDGKLDLLVDNGFGQCGGFPPQICGTPLEILLGNGDGTFKAPFFVNTFAQAQSKSPTLSAFAADFNGDGNVDIGALDGTSVNVYLGYGNGKGYFASADPFRLLAAGTNGFITGAVAGDLTGNKAPDIVGTNFGNADVGVLLNNTGSDFSISASAVTPATLGQGQSVTSILTLRLLNAFDYPVSLACSVQPTQQGSPTCSLSSNSVTFDSGGNATAVLTINAASTAASLVGPSSHEKLRPFNFLWLPVAGFALVGTGCGASRSRTKRVLLFLLGLVLFSGLMSQTACGGGSVVGSKSTTYTITITGTSGATQHTTNVALTVQ
jgi:hypothetical protein